MEIQRLQQLKSVVEASLCMMMTKGNWRVPARMLEARNEGATLHKRVLSFE